MTTEYLRRGHSPPVGQDENHLKVLASKCQGNMGVAVSCGYSTCFAVRTCDGLCDLIFSMDRVGIPFGFQPIMWTFVRHTVSRCLIFPAPKVTWSGLDQSQAFLPIQLAPSSSYLWVYMGCALAVVSKVRSLYVPT